MLIQNYMPCRFSLGSDGIFTTLLESERILDCKMKLIIMCMAQTLKNNIVRLFSLETQLQTYKQVDWLHVGCFIGNALHL